MSCNSTFNKPKLIWSLVPPKNMRHPRSYIVLCCIYIYTYVYIYLCTLYIYIYVHYIYILCTLYIYYTYVEIYIYIIHMYIYIYTHVSLYICMIYTHMFTLLYLHVTSKIPDDLPLFFCWGTFSFSTSSWGPTPTSLWMKLRARQGWLVDRVWREFYHLGDWDRL